MQPNPEQAGLETATTQLLSRLDMDKAACRAAAKGCIEALCQMLEFPHVSEGDTWSPGTSQCMAAAAAGQIAVLDWLHMHVKPDAWRPLVCTAAAGANKLEALRWLQTVCSPPCPCDVEAMKKAARMGHLDILKYLRSLKPPCPWDNTVVDLAVGHPECLAWLRQQSAPCNWNEHCMWEAVCQGDLEAVKRLRARDPPCPYHNWCLPGAVHRGDLVMVEWLCEQKSCPWSSDCFFEATRLGGRPGLKALQCLLSKGQAHLLNWKPACTQTCAALGDLAALQWLHEAGFRLSTRCPEWSAAAGHIDILSWLLSIGIQPEMPMLSIHRTWPAPTLMLWDDHRLPLPTHLTQRLRLARATFCTFHGLILWCRNWLEDDRSISKGFPFCRQPGHGQQLLISLAKLPDELNTKIAVAADLQHDFPMTVGEVI